MSGGVRILVVDDHAVVREGLSSMLARIADFEIVGLAAGGREALELAGSARPDVVLLDMQMPDMHGLEVLAGLTEMVRPPKVIVLTVHDDDELVLNAVRGGAQGYVLKSASREDLVGAIRHVAAGGQRFDEVVVRALLAEQTREQEPPPLSPRELEVLRLVAAGFSNKEVAAHLYLSVATVKTHLDDVYRKLGVSDRAHAVAVALRAGLLE
jgi:DNA-binding NarL/FixJ family response regulator